MMALCWDSQVKNWILNTKPITEKTLQIETKLKPKTITETTKIEFVHNNVFTKKIIVKK